MQSRIPDPPDPKGVGFRGFPAFSGGPIVFPAMEPECSMTLRMSPGISVTVSGPYDKVQSLMEAARKMWEAVGAATAGKLPDMAGVGAAVAEVLPDLDLKGAGGVMPSS